MSHSAATVAERYIATWNETDGERRQGLLDQHWAADAQYVDPLMRGDGPVQITGLIGAVHQRFPGFRFSLLGTPDGHGDYLRFRWSLGPAGAEAPIEGSDVLLLRGGRIAQVIGFIDKAPAA
jgi:hypothetical protein